MRQFTGFNIPTASPLGRIIINSQRLDLAAVRNGEPIRLEERTLAQLIKYNLKIKSKA